jgi:predicted nucleotidyltransferase
MPSDLLAQRIAARASLASARASRLRGVASEAARQLRTLGATRVILFGSLASGAHSHADSDIDLCVEGLAQGPVERFRLDASGHGDRLDIVRWETASPELRAVIETYGESLEDG